MTSNEEEEEEGQTTGHGRPNLWWKQQREAQERDVFKGEYRGVRNPKAGQQSVKPEDTIGDYETCWCGEPMDHDWPGKDKGRKHPRKVDQMSAAPVEGPHITKRDLNGFEDILTELIFTSVNIYGLRYRLTRTGIILYPKDGSDTYTIHRNANARSVKAAKVWFVKHVVELDKINESGLVKDKKAAVDVAVDTLVSRGSAAMNKEVTEDDLRRLAAEKNGPEHQVEPPPARPAQGKDGGSVPQSTESQEQLREEVRRRHHRTLAAAYPINPDGVWGPMYSRHKGALVEGFERFGETHKVRCTRCDWEGEDKGSSGHNLVHDKKRQEGLWGKKSQDKKRQTIATTQISKQVEQALTILHKAIGYQPEGDPKEMAALRARITALEVERDDLQARLDLMREALRA